MRERRVGGARVHRGGVSCRGKRRVLPAGLGPLAGGRRRRSAASLGTRGPGSGRCSSSEDSVALGRFRLFCPWGAQISRGSLPQRLAYTPVSRSLGALQLPLPRRSCISAEASLKYLAYSLAARPARICL